jgi:hypothetical protein
MATMVAGQHGRRADRDLKAVDSLLSRVDELSPSLRARAATLEHDIAHADDVDTGLLGALAALVSETYDVYAAALARRDGLDDGLCDVADRLLDELCTAIPDAAGLPTVLGQEDFFGPLSGAVRLRFPTDSIWGLPLVAHELGHHVTYAHQRSDGAGMVRRSVLPVADLLESELERTGPSGWSHLGELFADVFATWVAGPAFGSALVELRLTSRQSEPSFQHPAPGRRVDAVLRTLDALDSRGDRFQPSHQKTAERISERWERDGDVGLVGAAPSLLELLAPTGAISDSDLSAPVDTLVNMLSREFGAAAYARPPLAPQIDAYLLDGRTQLSVARVCDVLDAAWRVRLRPGHNVPLGTVARRAEALCRQVLVRQTDAERGPS